MWSPKLHLVAGKAPNLRFTGTSDGESSEPKSGKRKPPSSSLQKGMQSVATGETKKPSQQTMATWRRGDDELEPSAKMVALIEQLQLA